MYKLPQIRVRWQPLGRRFCWYINGMCRALRTNIAHTTATTLNIIFQLLLLPLVSHVNYSVDRKSVRPFRQALKTSAYCAAPHVTISFYIFPEGGHSFGRPCKSEFQYNTLNFLHIVYLSGLSSTTSATVPQAPHLAIGDDACTLTRPSCQGLLRRMRAQKRRRAQCLPLLSFKAILALFSKPHIFVQSSPYCNRRAPSVCLVRNSPACLSLRPLDQITIHCVHCIIASHTFYFSACRK